MDARDLLCPWCGGETTVRRSNERLVWLCADPRCPAALDRDAVPGRPRVVRVLTMPPLVESGGPANATGFIHPVARLAS